MLTKFYDHMCKHYQLYSFMANLFNAVSMAGLAGIGVLTDTMTVTWLVIWGVMFAVMFGVGKLLNQEIEDMDKVKGHRCGTTNDIEK